MEKITDRLRRELDDPQFPARPTVKKVGTLIGVYPDLRGCFLDLSGFMVTGLVQVSLRSIRAMWIRIQFGEDFLGVAFKHHPTWIAKTAYREKQPVVRSEHSTLVQ
jgi:hypothetical protein